MLAALGSLGVLLVTNPLWVFLLESVGLAGGYQWFAAMGWVYLLTTGGMGVLLLRDIDVTSSSVLGYTLLVFPVFVAVLYSGVGQPSPPSEVRSVFDQGLLLFPAALALPLIVGIRTNRTTETALSITVWLACWTLYALGVPNVTSQFNMFFLLLNYVGVLVFALPFIAAAFVITTPRRVLV